SGEPALAQEIAHSRLIGLSSALVKAQPESKTYPLTVALAGFCPLATRAATHTSKSEKGATTLVSFMFSVLSRTIGTPPEASEAVRGSNCSSAVSCRTFGVPQRDREALLRTIIVVRIYAEQRSSAILQKYYSFSGEIRLNESGIGPL